MTQFAQLPVCAHGCNHNCVFGCFQLAGPQAYHHHGVYPNPNLNPVQGQYGAPMAAPQYQFPPAHPNFYPQATSFSIPQQYPQPPFYPVQQQQQTFAQPPVQHNAGPKPSGVANFPYHVGATNDWGPSHPLLPIRPPATPATAPAPATSAPAPAPVDTVGTDATNNSVTNQNDLSGPDSEEGVLSKSRSDTGPESETVITPDTQNNFQQALAGSLLSQTTGTAPSNTVNSDVELTDTQSSGVPFLPQEHLEDLEAEARAKDTFGAQSSDATPVPKDSGPRHNAPSYNARLENAINQSIRENALEQAARNEAAQAPAPLDYDFSPLWLWLAEQQ